MFIAISRIRLERARIISRIMRVAEELGVPWDYPFEIHLVTPIEARRFLSYSRFVEIN